MTTRSISPVRGSSTAIASDSVPPSSGTASQRPRGSTAAVPHCVVPPGLSTVHSRSPVIASSA